jgi:hypothetical protein
MKKVLEILAIVVGTVLGLSLGYLSLLFLEYLIY